MEPHVFKRIKEQSEPLGSIHTFTGVHIPPDLGVRAQSHAQRPRGGDLRRGNALEEADPSLGTGCCVDVGGGVKN